MTAEGETTLTARPNSRSRHRRRRERTVRADDRRWQERASRWRTPASRQPRSARDQFRSPPHPASGQACAPVGSVTARRMMHQVCAARDTRGDLRDQCVPRPRPGWCPRPQSQHAQRRESGPCTPPRKKATRPAHHARSRQSCRSDDRCGSESLEDLHPRAGARHCVPAARHQARESRAMQHESRGADQRHHG